MLKEEKLTGTQMKVNGLYCGMSRTKLNYKMIGKLKGEEQFGFLYEVDMQK